MTGTGANTYATALITFQNSEVTLSHVGMPNKQQPKIGWVAVIHKGPTEI